MLILTQHVEQRDNPFPEVIEHFVSPEGLRFYATTADGTHVITADGSLLRGVQEAPFTIARMRALWERRAETKQVAEDGELMIAVRAGEEGDARLVACLHVASRRMVAKVEATRAMADDLSDRADEAQALAAEAEAALAQARKS